jgi:hypothetical protein
MTKGYRWWTGVAGIAFVALIVPSIVTEVMGPNPTASPAEVFAKFHTARTDVLISSVLLVAARSALLVFIVGVTEVVRGPEPDLLRSLARSAGSLGVGLVVIYTAIFAMVAAVISEFDNAQLVYGLFRAAYSINSASHLFIGLFLTAIAVPLSRAGLGGRWFARFGVFAGLFYAIGSLSFTSKGEGIFSVFEVVGSVFFIVWAAVTSVRLLHSSPT